MPCTDVHLSLCDEPQDKVQKDCSDERRIEKVIDIPAKARIPASGQQQQCQSQRTDDAGIQKQRGRRCLCILRLLCDKAASGNRVEGNR